MLLRIIAIPLIFLIPGFLAYRIFTRKLTLASLLFSIALRLPLVSLVAFGLATFAELSLGKLITAVLCLSIFLAIAVRKQRSDAEKVLLKLFDTRYCAALLLIVCALFA